MTRSRTIAITLTAFLLVATAFVCAQSQSTPPTTPMGVVMAAGAKIFEGTAAQVQVDMEVRRVYLGEP